MRHSTSHGRGDSDGSTSSNPTTTTPPPSTSLSSSPADFNTIFDISSTINSNSNSNSHNTYDDAAADALPPQQLPEKPPSSNAATGASAAGVRALTSQAVAFYFRAPVKAFFRTRVDYLAYARALHEQQLAAAGSAAGPMSRPAEAAAGAAHRFATTHTPTPTSTPTPTPNTTRGLGCAAWRWLRTRLGSTTPGVLASAVRQYGWRVVPDQVVPPLAANVGVGAVLYTSYLQVLGRLHAESGLASRRVYPPPGPAETFAAGFLAGGIQSVVAAPLDAVQARWDVGASAAGMTGSGNPAPSGGIERPKSMWAFSAAKLREIGLRGIFAGWSLSFLKDSLGSAVFFSVFEYVKAQGYYSFVTWYYGSLNQDALARLSRKRPAPPGRDDGGDRHPDDGGDGGYDYDDIAAAPRMPAPAVIRPHYAIEPAFLLLAGMSASLAQQVVLHPLSHVQAEHWERLEALDAQARRMRNSGRSAAAAAAAAEAEAAEVEAAGWRWRRGMFRAYRDAYRVTWAKCVAEARAAGLGMRQWLYRGFWWNTIRQVPSTSAGLIIFELFRRKYGLDGDKVRINRDGYDILLS